MMKKLSEMTRDQLLDYINYGEHCDQETIDLYDELMELKESQTK